RRAAGARLAMTTGVFNLLWAAVVVLMIVRPGSTTGV
ncbi:membrane protein, partial [Streptomyces sp. MBRL 601]